MVKLLGKGSMMCGLDFIGDKVLVAESTGTGRMCDVCIRSGPDGYLGKI